MIAFRLAGLMRVRTLREDRARLELALVQARAATAAREAAHHEHVVGRAVGPRSDLAPVFLATVAARSSEVAALTEALAMQAVATADVAIARDEWVQSRNRTRVVQRLSDLHAEQQRRERDRVDQLEADDRSGTSVARARTEQEPS